MIRLKLADFCPPHLTSGAWREYGWTFVPYALRTTTAPTRPDLIKKGLVRHPRFQVHYAPTYSSWINQVECWFAILTEKQLRRGTHRGTQALEDAIRLHLTVYNENPKPFVRVKTADNIRRFCL